MHYSRNLMTIKRLYETRSCSVRLLASSQIEWLALYRILHHSTMRIQKRFKLNTFLKYMNHSTIPGRTYVIRCKAPANVTCTRNDVEYPLVTHPGDEQEMCFTAISTSVDITCDGDYALQEAFNSALALMSQGGGSIFDASVLQRKVIALEKSEMYHYYSEADHGTVVRVSVGADEAFAPVLDFPSKGKSYEMVFEITPLAETSQAWLGGEVGTPEWQFVDQAPKPSSWEVGKTYCFTVLYMDGVTRPLVATSYTRDAQ